MYVYVHQVSLPVFLLCHTEAPDGRHLCHRVRILTPPFMSVWLCVRRWCRRARCSSPASTRLSHASSRYGNRHTYSTLTSTHNRPRQHTHSTRMHEHIEQPRHTMCCDKNTPPSDTSCVCPTSCSPQSSFSLLCAPLVAQGVDGYPGQAHGPSGRAQPPGQQARQHAGPEQGTRRREVLIQIYV